LYTNDPITYRYDDEKSFQRELSLRWIHQISPESNEFRLIKDDEIGESKEFDIKWF
jgi:hypothetical protein